MPERKAGVPCAGVRSDEWLMQRVQTGDGDAFATLLDRYRGRLFGFLVRRSGESADVEDLFQETWMRVVRARARFDPSQRFSTWLFQIANNLCRDRGRRRGVEAKAHETMLEIAEINPDVAPALDLQLDIHRRIGRLPDPLREVLLLRYYHQFSEREIAQMVDIPPGTVKSRLHTAVRRLRVQEAE